MHRMKPGLREKGSTRLRQLAGRQGSGIIYHYNSMFTYAYLKLRHMYIFIKIIRKFTRL